jgi:hypothetical protein
MAKFSLNFHFNSFSYLCVALYIHFPYRVRLLSSLWCPSQWLAIPTVETKAIHHTDTQDPIRTRSNTITTTNQRDTTARHLATVTNLMAMIIRNQATNTAHRLTVMTRNPAATNISLLLMDTISTTRNQVTITAHRLMVTIRNPAATNTSLILLMAMIRSRAMNTVPHLTVTTNTRNLNLTAATKIVHY